MASSIDVDKLLECPICLEQLKQPKMLKCQHTFCFDPCLQKMAKMIRKKKKYQIECAICREKCAVEELSDFADNLYVKNLLEIRNNPPKSQNTTVLGGDGFNKYERGILKLSNGKHQSIRVSRRSTLPRGRIVQNQPKFQVNTVDQNKIPEVYQDSKINIKKEIDFDSEIVIIAEKPKLQTCEYCNEDEKIFGSVEDFIKHLKRCFKVQLDMAKVEKELAEAKGRVREFKLQMELEDLREKMAKRCKRTHSD